MKEKVAVTGLGVITSNGRGVAEFFENCKAGKRGITDQPCPLFDTGCLRTPYWGTIRSITSYDSENAVADRSQLLAQIAIDEAMADAGIQKDYIRSLGDRAVLTVGSLSIDEYHFLKTAEAVKTGEDGSAFLLAGLSDFTHVMKEYCGISGACYNYSSACSSSAVAVGMGIELIRSGICDLVIACGVDSLSKIVAYGFHSLKALSRGLCHPLDQNRDGINVGEGCGVMVLESYSHALKRNAKIYAECAGYSIGNEAFHITSPDISGQGFYRSMRDALEDAGIGAEDIDYINLHGTGTPVNDSTEISALKKLYPSNNLMPYFSSLKVLIGHCMGAAGIIEAILTVLCLHHQYYFPVFYVDKPMEDMTGLSIEPPKPGTSMEYAMTNAFAFSGNTSSLIFRRGEIGAGESASYEIGGQKSDGEKHMLGLSDEIWLNGLGILVSEGKEDISIPEISARKLRGAGKLSRMVLSSALRAEKDAGDSHAEWNPEDTGAFFSTGYGAVSEAIEFGKNVVTGEPDSCSPIGFANISQNAPLGHLAINMRCQGASGSLHGAVPLMPSVFALRNCETVLSCFAEEHDTWLEKALDKGQGIKGQAVTLLLQRHPSAASYGRIGYYICVDLSVCHKASLPSSAPDLILLQDTDALVTEKEKNRLGKAFPNAEIRSAYEVQGEYLGTPFYANIAMAAGILRDGLSWEGKKSGVGSQIERIMVTGYDSCKNYHIVMLYRR